MGDSTQADRGDSLLDAPSTGQPKTSGAHAWFDSGICVDSLSSASSILSSAASGALSSRLAELELEPPPAAESDPHDARLIQQLATQTMHTFLPDADGDT